LQHLFLKFPITKKKKATIDLNSRLFMMGSCFGENMSKKLEYYTFNCWNNPLGIAFHPDALQGMLMRILEKRLFKEEDLFFHQERWHCFEVHSQFSTDKHQKVLLEELNTQIIKSHELLKETTHLFLTLGSAWGYLEKQSQKIVANCHKMPQKQFSKTLSSVTELSEKLASLVTALTTFNPKLQILLTVSPIRHTKDGIIENNRSKAHLIAAVHQCIDLQKTNSVHYFPAYEILLDTLREYRFYESDLIHPNAVAIDYIWEQFKETWISPETTPVLQQIENIQKRLKHKPLNPKSSQHQAFLKKLEDDISTFQKKHPNITAF